MSELSRILKKDAVPMARRRLKEKLAPLGFRPHPLDPRRRLARVRKGLVEEIYLWADGRKLKPSFHVSLQVAPYARLWLDECHLERVQKGPSGPLWWQCVIPDRPPQQYYYERDHFEAVWQYLEAALDEAILPCLDGLTLEKAVSLFGKRSDDAQDLFQPWPCDPDLEPEQAVWAVGQWRLERYVEGAAQLLPVRELYRRWMAEESGKPATDHFTESRRQTLALLEALCQLWEDKPADWTATAQSLLDQATERWPDYTPW